MVQENYKRTLIQYFGQKTPGKRNLTLNFVICTYVSQALYKDNLYSYNGVKMIAYIHLTNQDYIGQLKHMCMLCMQ